ncbi:MAG TPA: amidohydrolase family protein [Woeseiaceae bacterium]|nr:amidohydrolase family protein [Woeseiaceae bacterium]
MHRFVVFAIFGLASAAAVAEVAAFVNVNVIPMSGERIVAQQTVIVSDGIIGTIGNVDEVPVPEGARLIDGTDRFLIPGLGEMHAHVPPVGSGDLERDFALFVANGVTTVRGMLGHPSHLELRSELLDGEAFGPRLITSGPSLNGRSVSGAADGERQVREQHEAGYDFVKIHPGLDDEEFAAIAATANELGIPIAGHVPVAVGLEKALASGMASIDHLDGYMAALMPPNFDASGGYGGLFDVLLAGDVDEDGIPALVAATAAAGTWNVPTETLVEQLINEVPASVMRRRVEMRYVPEATIERWIEAKERQQNDRGFSSEIAVKATGLRRALIRRLHEAGAGILLGSDAPQVFNVPGFSLHRELELMVAAGLTPFEALKAGTVNVARFLGLRTGVVETGREADLVMLDSNPLEDISNTRRVHGVMVRGQWYSAGDIEALLERFRLHDDDGIGPFATKRPRAASYE